MTHALALRSTVCAYHLLGPKVSTPKDNGGHTEARGCVWCTFEVCFHFAKPPVKPVTHLEKFGTTTDNTTDTHDVSKGE